MVEHIVLLKLKAATTDQQLANLSSALLAMRDEIPGICEVTTGINHSPEGKSQGFSYGFIVRFTDEKARDDYLPHPKHLSVATEFIRPLVEDVLVFDYTV
jgi:hypothetical protein